MDNQRLSGLLKKKLKQKRKKYVGPAIDLTFGWISEKENDILNKVIIVPSAAQGIFYSPLPLLSSPIEEDPVWNAP